MRLALYQPDIPQNAGAIMRLAACFGVPVDIIEPCGFVLSDKLLRRAAMDYIDLVKLERHISWADFLEQRQRVSAGRLILLTTQAREVYTDFTFGPGDTLLLGRETAGAPEEVHAAADARLWVPIRTETRSLNVVATAAMVLGEALRQTGMYEELRG